MILVCYFVDFIELINNASSFFFLPLFIQLRKPVEGLEEWLDAVSTSRIPCAVVSSLDRKNMVEALEGMGIKKYFQVGFFLFCFFF